jgi:hypothetical protein
VNDELQKELAGLAAKLGVSVEHLWGVLVRQAYIDGVSSLVTVFCCAAAGVGVLWFFVYRRRKYKLTAEPKERFFFSTNEPLEYLVLGTILFFLVAIAGDNLYWVITDFFNPEFYALRHLPFP